MGIAYDWVNQRLIQRKTKSKTKTKETGRKEDTPIMCLGPITTNLRHWHFSFRGAGDNLYNKGVYHGRIVLPKDYPLSPPSVQMWTPSGRFVPFKDICLTASNYHPETWTPRWNIHGIVNALRLHMLTTPSEIGGIQTTADETIEFARLSLGWQVIFETGGGNSAKPTRITVDHELLLRQGVIGTEPVSDEGDEIEENISLSAIEDTDSVS
jgi:ubiquitin-protein ligase